jgi:adenine-specific DNA-methyltransferase
VSRLNDLLRQLENSDPALAKDLRREFDALSSRRAFGLNFERHVPEAVELPGRPIRRGDKVRILAPRGSKASEGDDRLWRVGAITRDATGTRSAALELRSNQDETAVALVDDLVVVAEFRDPIYPGLVSTGEGIKRGGGKPYHAVINAENYHALQTLLLTHRSKVDVIYIDPPYNTGAKDWKYNNDYVEGEDHYRHSKWLAFMERRLRIAKELLNPTDSVLIVAIDEKEVHRLGLLLEQVFPDVAEANVVMVTTVISAKGAVRPGRFSRVEEHLFFVFVGSAKVRKWDNNMLPSYKEDDEAGVIEGDEIEVDEPPKPIEWLGLRRREPSSTRGSRPNQFYPIFVHTESGWLNSIGDAVDDDVDRQGIAVPPGCVALWPLKPDGTEMLWGLTPDVLRRNWDAGFARVNNWKPETRKGTVQYLPSGTIGMIRSGLITVTDRAPDGHVIGYFGSQDSGGTPPKRVWHMRSHNAETGGTNVLSALIPQRRFDYPKSLYAVEDALRFVVGDKQEALIVDFFAGSGTTTHAVVRLNKQTGGSRQSICVTNNEVAANEQIRLREQGLRPGDPEWERWGICDHVTKPRIAAAITGMTPTGNDIQGHYKFTDKFPMADGFEENVEFFTLTYEAPLRVSSNREFGKIAALLWLRAGSEGRRIEDISAGWDVADTYGVLTDLDQSEPFAKAVATKDGIRVVFVVTDEDRLFESVVRELPEGVEPVRMYDAYLQNFEIETGRSAL